MQRSLSRLIAVQTLFSIEATRRPYQAVLTEMTTKNTSELLDDEQSIQEFDARHLKKIVVSAIENQREIDKETDKVLKDSWPLKKIDPILRAIFRSAGAELKLGSVPKKVVINEHIEVARAFDDRNETIAFANAVLDKLAGALID